MGLYVRRVQSSYIRKLVGTTGGWLNRYLGGHCRWDEKSKEKIVSAAVPANEVEGLLELAKVTREFMWEFDKAGRSLAGALDQAIRAVLGLRSRGTDDDDLR